MAESPCYRDTGIYLTEWLANMWLNNDYEVNCEGILQMDKDTFLSHKRELEKVAKLYLQGNNIGDAGAAAIGEALQNNRVLNTLYLNFNQISEASHQALQDVVQGRGGFKLQV